MPPSKIRALQDKVILVTGSSHGIGRAVAMYCAEQGAYVVVNGRPSGSEVSGVDLVVDEIRSRGGCAISVEADVANYDAVGVMIEETVTKLGRLDGVVHAAGPLRDSIFHKMTLDHWMSVVTVHLHGAFNVSRLAAEVFRNQESGSIVHLVSTSGLIGKLGQANYCAAKMGVVGLSRSIAIDMKRFGTRSNCVAPFAWTRMASSLSDSPCEASSHAQLFKDVGPETVAPLVAFLLSNMSHEVTGQIFCVRSREIMVFNQSRPVRSVHRGEGWTIDSLAAHAHPSLRGCYTPLETSEEHLDWPPV